MTIPFALFPRRIDRALALIGWLLMFAGCARGGSRVDTLCATAEAASAKDDFVRALDAYGEKSRAGQFSHSSSGEVLLQALEVAFHARQIASCGGWHVE